MEDYDRWENSEIDNVSQDRDFREIEKHIYNGSRVLDAGCGDGSILKKLHGSNAIDYYGIDVSELAIRRAISGNGLEARRLSADSVTSIPFEDSFFDVVICTNVIEHILDTKKALSEMKRVLKKGGLLLISTPSHSFVSNILNVLFGRFEVRYNPYGGHIRFYTRKSLTGVLEDSGFKLVSFKDTEYLHGIIPKTMFVVARKV